MPPTTEILALVHAPDDAAYALELSQILTPAFLARLRLRPLLAGERLADAHVLLVLESPGLEPALHDVLDHARGQGRLLIPIPLRACLAPPSALRGLKRALDEVILRDDTAALPRAARDAAWNQVALSLDLAVTRHGEQRGSHPRAARRRRLVPDPRRALYIEVLREREAFVVRHLMPSPRGLDLLGERRVSAHDPADGQALFQLLFPEESWRPTLHRVLRLAHQSSVVPTHRPVALRVLCQDAALPPGLLHDLRWEGYPLRDASWTCEWAARTPQSGTPEDIKVLDLPARALLLGAASAEEVTPVLEALSCVAPVRDGRAELVGLHLAGQPALTALRDAAEPACEILLLLGGAPGLPALLQRLRTPPLLAYADHPLPPRELEALRRVVPVVIVGRGERALLLRFLRALPLSPDPVEALHRAARAAARPGVDPSEDLWPRFPTVYSRGLLQVKAEPRQPLEGSPWLKLDRTTQRGQAKHEINDGLLRSRLVEAMVVFGARGNHVGDFLQQMTDELVGQVELLAPVTMSGIVPEPGDDDALPSRLRRAAAVDLCGSDEPTLGDALATQVHGPEVQLLILSYGVHDYGSGQGQVTPQVLKDWLAFCAALTKEARLPLFCPSRKRTGPELW